MPSFECINCASKLEAADLDPRCGRCGSAVLLAEPEGAVAKSEVEALPPGVWRFRHLLPKIADHSIVTLGEGGTPLLPAKRLGDQLGFENLLVKDETRNPTGSFMDRGSTVFVSLAQEKAIRRLSCTTTGNLGASLAAYSAKAGIELSISIHPSTEHGKLYQMIAYGAKVEILPSHPKRDGTDLGSFVVSAGNPFILEGEKTTGFEIIKDLDWEQPDAIVLPIGTGGHLTMVWRALLQLRESGLIGAPTSRLIGVQLKPSPRADRPSGKVSKSREAEATLTELEEAEPIFKAVATRSIRDSRGISVGVSAKEAIDGTSLLARTEGVYAEPAAASVVAALKVAREKRILESSHRIVCVITGTGLKDTKTVRKLATAPRRLISGDEVLIRPLQLGTTKLALMRELSHGPAFGYGLWENLSRQRSITTASVYQHLSELERAALIRRSRVATVRGRERIFYELTTRGAEILGMVEKAKQAGTPGLGRRR